MTTSIRSSVLCLGLILVALPPGNVAEAGKPAKQAQSVLKKRAAQALAQFKKSTALRRKLLDAEIDSIIQDVKSGTVTTGAAGALFDALVDFQKDVVDDVADASVDYREGFGEALVILADAGVATADWPTGFFYGDSSTSDSLRADMEKALLGLYPKVSKRVKKLSSALRKEADVALTCRLAPPTTYLEWIVSPGGGGAALLPKVLTLDVAVGVSDLGQTSDADFYLGGSCESGDGQLQTWNAYSSGAGVLSTVTPTSDDRWKLVVQDRAEGNYDFKVALPGTAIGAYVAIGVD